MKIAIQGHLTKGKEVIQILESLGGINPCNHSGNNFCAYYEIHGNLIYCMSTKSDNIKYYTLEEFEKEFPFKVGDKVIFPIINGWLSGKIIGIKDFEYEVDTIKGYRYIEPHKLSLYPMKEERNITLTLDKAKEWYNKGGELKEIALQAFTEKELTKIELPKTWKEFCKNYSMKNEECYIGVGSQIHMLHEVEGRDVGIDRNVCPSQKSAEAHLAMIQLEQLRDCWRQGWKPNWLEGNVQKHIIRKWRDKISIETTYVTHSFLSFPTYEMAEEFLECFKDLIEKAEDLI